MKFLMRFFQRRGVAIFNFLFASVKKVALPIRVGSRGWGMVTPKGKKLLMDQHDLPFKSGPNI